MKKYVSLFLSVLMMITSLTVLPLAVQAEDAANNRVVIPANLLSVGDKFEMGMYPQSKVTDSATLDALNAMDIDCDKDYYPYMSGYYNYIEHLGWHVVDMFYVDVEYNGEKYRKVIIDEYRPYKTVLSSEADNSNQDENGYTVGNTYYFKWEPIVWWVLAKEADSVYITSEKLLDSQGYCDYDEQDAKWKSSTLRSWLNNTFYNQTFSAEEKDKILQTELENAGSPYDDAISGGENTTDNVWLLSYEDANNEPYEFASRLPAYGTDYAKCQGLFVSDLNSSNWWLRNPGDSAKKACLVDIAGDADNSQYACYTSPGVRPALKLEINAQVSWVGPGREVSVYMDAEPIYSYEQKEIKVHAPNGATALEDYSNKSFTITVIDSTGKEYYTENGGIENWEKIGRNNTYLLNWKTPLLPAGDYLIKFSFFSLNESPIPASDIVSFKVYPYAPSVLFVDEDDTVLQESNWQYGETPIYSGSALSKLPDVNYHYHAQWDKEITPIGAASVPVGEPIPPIYYRASYNKEEHTYGKEGNARFTCTVCGFINESLKADAEKADKAAAEKAEAERRAAEEAEKARIVAEKAAQESANAAFVAGVNGTAAKNKATVKWGKVKCADRYVIYAAYCGKKTKYKKIKTVKGSVTKYDIKKLNGKKLNPKKNIKVYVVAQKKNGKKYKTLFKTPTFHIAGAQSKNTNVKKIKVKKSQFTLAVGKTAKIKPTLVLNDKAKKPIEHVAKYRYQSSNTAVVKVSKKGKIKAVGKGKAVVYVYSNNGTAKAINITVK